MSTPLDRPITCPVLIGRDRQLNALLRLLASATGGHGHAALLVAALRERLTAGPARTGQQAVRILAGREADFNVAIIERWGDPTDADAHIAWPRQFHEALRPHARGVYVNYLSEEGADRVRAAYTPAQYARLVALKTKYDPANLFHLNQNIASRA